MRTTRLGVVCALLACLWTCAARPSCTHHGQVSLPCDDELRLEPSDRFLLTLFGHSCYVLDVTSLHPLDVYFYDSTGWNHQQPARALAQTNMSKTLKTLSLKTQSTMYDAHICKRVSHCYVAKQELSPRALYDLVISPGRDPRHPLPATASHVFITIEQCDPTSTWLFIGLVMTALGGFLAMLVLLCLIGEYVLGLRPYSRFRRKLQSVQFIELPQLEPSESRNRLDKATRYVDSETDTDDVGLAA